MWTVDQLGRGNLQRPVDGGSYRLRGSSPAGFGWEGQGYSAGRLAMALQDLSRFSTLVRSGRMLSLQRNACLYGPPSSTTQQRASDLAHGNDAGSPESAFEWPTL